MIYILGTLLFVILLFIFCCLKISSMCEEVKDEEDAGVPITNNTTTRRRNK